MRSILSKVAIFNVSCMLLNAAFADKIAEQCEQRTRVGIANAFEIIGILEPLIVNGKDCRDKKLSAKLEALHTRYVNTNASDMIFRQTYSNIAPTSQPIQFENSGQLTTLGSLKESNDDYSRPIVPVVKGYSNVVATDK